MAKFFVRWNTRQLPATLL